MVQSGSYVRSLEPLRPPFEGPRRHLESRLHDFADPDHALCDTSPCQGTHHRTRPPHVVAIIEMVTAWVVIADGLLDPLEPQHSRVEVGGAAHVADDRC